MNFGKVYLKLIKIKLAELTDYQSEVESFLERKRKESNSEYATIDWDDIDDEEYKAFLKDTLAEEYHNYQKYYPNLLRSAIIFQTYSVLEKYLIKLCDFMKEHKGLSKAVKKSGGAFNNAITYLTTEFPINKSELNPEFEFIDCVRLLRNKITHENGEVSCSKSNSPKEARLIKFMLSENSISTFRDYSDFKKGVEGTYEINIISGDLNAKFIAAIEKLFEKIVQRIF